MGVADADPCVEFHVHGPPVPWMRAGSVGHARYTPPRQRAYQRLVRTVAMAALARCPGWRTDRRYAVEVQVTPPDRRRADLDNYIKSAIDSLNGLAWDDDSQIDGIIGIRLPPDKKTTGLRIFLRYT